jgi:hypothetical protein
VDVPCACVALMTVVTPPPLVLSIVIDVGQPSPPDPDGEGTQWGLHGRVVRSHLDHDPSVIGRRCASSDSELHSPPFTRAGTLGREDPADDQDPDEGDDRPDEPRIGAIRRPETAARQRRATEDTEDDACDPRRKQPVLDDARPPQAERPGHDQHRPRDKARPSGPMIRVGAGVRVRRDRIDNNGKVTLRHRTRMHLIGVGHAHKGKRVIMLVDGLDVRVVSQDGELLRQLTLDPTRDYQPQG